MGPVKETSRYKYLESIPLNDSQSYSLVFDSNLEWGH